MESLRTRLTLPVLIILLLAMGDILIDAVFDRGHVFKVVAGSKALISGKLMGSIKPYTNKNAIFGNQVNDPALLDEILVTDPPHQAFRIRFLELKGRVWRAELLTDSGGAPGDYPVRIFQRSLGPDPDMPVLRVQIFPDPESLRASQKSLFRRYLGIPPWIVAGLLAPLVALILYLTYRASDGSISALQARGIGPIYKMAYRKTGWEILYGLGTAHGLRIGDRLELIDARQRPTGYHIVVEQVGGESGEAILDPSVPMRPGWLVARCEPVDQDKIDSTSRPG